ncbi:hypothetical protein [Vibrio maerlii]|uniref:hypothetical protein n=1 Tax=Vibrio maerlii TaxID=2231648 RepID=UPI000F5002C3|nr:hypothetical protein [Vibrio maerlii]
MSHLLVSSRKNQSGVITLLVTSALLIGSLLIILGYYKGLFYQIKRAQNEVNARQQYWLAEGGLECAYTKAVLFVSPKYFDQNYYNINPDFAEDFWSSECENVNSGLSVHSTKTSRNLYQLTASYGNSSVHKHIDYRRTVSSGALQSTSDLIVHGSTVFSPPDPGTLSSDGWECKAVVFNRYFYSSGVRNQGLVGTPSPYGDFSGGACATHSNSSQSYRTSSSSYSGVVPDSFDSDGHPIGNQHFNIGLDFSQQTDLSPFQALFDYPKTEWIKVLNSEQYDFDEAIVPQSVSACGASVLAALRARRNAGKANHVWVQGSCELDATALKAINDMTATAPALIVVQNGILSLNNDGSEGVINPINGLLYHFNNDYSHQPNHWNDTRGKSALDGAVTVFDASLDTIYGANRTIVPRNATFLQSGAITFNGGVVFDTSNELALSNSSMNFRYSADAIDQAIGPKQPRWLQGSWHDE